MKITEDFLRSKKACFCGLDWFLEQGTQDPLELIDLAVADGKSSSVFWVFKFFLNKAEAVRFSVFCAELVLHIFEEEFLYNDHPRKAIKAAKEWLETGVDNNCTSCAACDAACAAYDAAVIALSVSRSASDAARAAYDAAVVALSVSRSASTAAVRVAACSNAVRADITVLPRIINYIKQYIGEKKL